MTDLHVSEAVRYVGADDTTLDLFEGQYPIPNGVSYNSYVILDGKIAIMDTVDRRATEAWLKNLEEVLGGRKPDYLVIQHLEPDHAGNIGLAAEKYPDMILVGNAKTFQMLPKFFPGDYSARSLTVKEGDTLSLGSHTLTFVMAPMVHWPEVMVSYESSEKILFSADGFGKFGALSVREDWLCEARRYYMNIVGKYGAQVQALLKKAASLDIQTICPLHGPVLKEDLGFYLGKYDLWSRYEPEDEGVLVAYASIHGRTVTFSSFTLPRPTPPVPHLRRRSLPAHGPLYGPPAGQDLPEPHRGRHRKRLLGPRRRQDHALLSGEYEECHHLPHRPHHPGRPQGRRPRRYGADRLRAPGVKSSFFFCVQKKKEAKKKKLLRETSFRFWGLLVPSAAEKVHQVGHRLQLLLGQAVGVDHRALRPGGEDQGVHRQIQQRHHLK